MEKKKRTKIILIIIALIALGVIGWCAWFLVQYYDGNAFGETLDNYIDKVQIERGTKTVHGSHVIISCDGLTPPEKTIEEAAQLAVYYSQARDGGKTQVDYTMVRNVRKPSGSLPGKVIYTDYSTLSVSADEALAEKLRVK